MDFFGLWILSTKFIIIYNSLKGPPPPFPTKVVLNLHISAEFQVRERPDMMSASEGEGFMEKRTSEGRLRKFYSINQIQQDKGQEKKGGGKKIRKFCGHHIWKLPDRFGRSSYRGDQSGNPDESDHSCLLRHNEFRFAGPGSTLPFSFPFGRLSPSPPPKHEFSFQECGVLRDALSQ